MPATLTSLENDIRNLEHENWEAFKARDTQKLRQLTADRMLLVMNEGIYEDSRDGFVDMMGNGTFRLKSYRLDESEAKFAELAPGVVAYAYKAHMEYDREGKPGTSDSYFTSTWVKKGSNWQQAVSTEIPTKRGS